MKRKSNTIGKRTINRYNNTHNFDTSLAAMTGIHGVSSSLWLPINQSASGNKSLSEGVMAAS